MKWGVIAITVSGLEVAKRLKTELKEVDIYTLPKFLDTDTKPIEGELSSFTGELFKNHKTLIYIMATGIVVRCIASHLTDKTVDPAVVVMDEQGKYAISLLSGHLGGANAAALYIAKTIGSQAIITTASDGKGVASVDMIAQMHNLKIASMQDAKELTAMAVNDKRIGWRNDTHQDLPHYFNWSETECDGLVVVSNEIITHDKPMAQLIPQNITIGVGCRRGVLGSTIIEFVTEQLAINNLHPLSIEQLASVDLKMDEEGIHETAKHFKVPLTFTLRAEIETIETQFDASDFVKSKIGVSSVCEPVAFIAGGRKGRFISKKQSKDGVTVAIFERKI